MAGFEAFDRMDNASWRKGGEPVTYETAAGLLITPADGAVLVIRSRPDVPQQFGGVGFTGTEDTVDVRTSQVPVTARNDRLTFGNGSESVVSNWRDSDDKKIRTLVLKPA